MRQHCGGKQEHTDTHGKLTAARHTGSCSLEKKKKKETEEKILMNMLDDFVYLVARPK